MSGGSEIGELIRRAEALRRRSARPPTEAWRVLNGAGDGAPGSLTLDRFGRWLVLAVREENADQAAVWASAALDVLDADGLVTKVLRRPARASTSTVFAGTLPAEPIRVKEYDATFLCALDDGISTGLFLDQREGRQRIRPLARGVEVLNLFSYTGAFSVHAALGGATRVTSVDVSKKALQRGRDNMRASGIDPDRHRWFPDDAREHLSRAGRRGTQYGLVILDPPTFGTGAGHLSLERGLEELAALAVAVTAPDGALLFAVHAASIGEERALSAVESAADRADRGVEVLARLGLPAWDHPAPSSAADLDRGQYLKTLILKILFSRSVERTPRR
jgi:23S rRNA (cytosine1962-C5)-methyltransferase